MLRAALALIVAAVPFTLAAAPQIIAPAPCLNPLVHEPLVVYDVNGSTLVGAVYRNLEVYNDGYAQIHQVGTGGFYTTKAEVAFIGASAAASFASSLAAAGAGTLCDDSNIVLDVPMQTLTTLRDATDTRGHTFSWWIPTGAYTTVDQKIQSFISATFPNF
jgi:hypothetical protein